MTELTQKLQLIIPITVAILLAACSSAPQIKSSQSRETVAPGTTQPQSQVGQPAPNMPKAGSGRGAYYKDDGPGDNPPSNLELTLDAEPKVEPYLTSCSKPYVVFGKTYTPILDNRPFTERGTGSWYGKKFHGQKTSSGELYDMYKMTAAHPTLPIPSYARITDLANGKQVIVRINDRGPFHTNRIVDLSYTAALKLGYLGKGSSELLLERLLPADIEKMAEAKKNGTAVAATPIPAPETQDSAKLDALIREKSAADAAPPAISDNAAVADAMLIPAVTTTPNTVSGYYLQFGAFGLRSNAEATFIRLQSKLAQLPEFEIVRQGTLYRLFSGPFASHEDAHNALQMAAHVGVPQPIIVQR